jgi:hypothetical protein
MSVFPGRTTMRLTLSYLSLLLFVGLREAL